MNLLQDRTLSREGQEVIIVHQATVREVHKGVILQVIVGQVIQVIPRPDLLPVLLPVIIRAEAVEAAAAAVSVQ